MRRPDSDSREGHLLGELTKPPRARPGLGVTIPTAKLGDGTTANKTLPPVKVAQLAGVKAITGGATAGYALRVDGTVWAWGSGSEGALGDGGTTTVQSTPVQVAGLTNVIAIALEQAVPTRDPRSGRTGPSGRGAMAATARPGLEVPRLINSSRCRCGGWLTLLLLQPGRPPATHSSRTARFGLGVTAATGHEVTGSKPTFRRHQFRSWG